MDVSVICPDEVCLFLVPSHQSRVHVGWRNEFVTLTALVEITVCAEIGCKQLSILHEFQVKRGANIRNSKRFVQGRTLTGNVISVKEFRRHSLHLAVILLGFAARE